MVPDGPAGLSLIKIDSRLETEISEFPGPREWVWKISPKNFQTQTPGAENRKIDFQYQLKGVFGTETQTPDPKNSQKSRFDENMSLPQRVSRSAKMVVGKGDFRIFSKLSTRDLLRGFWVKNGPKPYTSLKDLNFETH